MGKFKNRLLASLLFVSMIVSCIPFNSFASEVSTLDTYVSKVETSDTYVSKELGVAYERIIKKDKVTVIMKSLDGAIIHTVMNYNGQTYLDGKVILDDNDNYSNTKEFNVNSNETFVSTLSVITWGLWQTNTVANFATGGWTTATGAAIMAAKLGWCPWSVLLAIAGTTAGMYEQVTVKVKMRYGSDDLYFYYQRYTYFYGDGVLMTLPENPFYDTGKEYL